MCTVFKHYKTADDSYIVRPFSFHCYAALLRRKEGEGVQLAAQWRYTHTDHILFNFDVRALE